ncbi:DUF397 domain-containing protein [Streptomyces sp. ISL-10]|uniref:DUF397 domain-containing protein n=1 Tax=Streptomyces sp. ISL-10 TaxID=2819172 RepID=UPI001BE63F47|nr:DUF397 domain-containing protein [Streptomyces sp. ISL-10]MBT2367015.1 DUF397 domain-containing protein [Streptomyces sp. ISL-10]
MTNPNPISSRDPQWFKSSRSNGSGGECVECAHAGTGILIRDSKRPTGPVVAVATDAWQTFVEGVTLRL